MSMSLVKIFYKMLKFLIAAQWIIFNIIVLNYLYLFITYIYIIKLQKNTCLMQFVLTISKVSDAYKIAKKHMFDAV